jgi:hypothetical protein
MLFFTLSTNLRETRVQRAQVFQIKALNVECSKMHKKQKTNYMEALKCGKEYFVLPIGQNQGNAHAHVLVLAGTS